MKNDVNPSQDTTTTPDDVTETPQINGEQPAHSIQDDVAEVQAQIEEEQRIWNTPEMTRDIQAVLNSTDEGDRDVIVPLQKMMDEFHGRCAAFEKWKESYITSQTTPPAPVPIEEETVADQLLKPYFHAQGRTGCARQAVLRL